MEYYLGIDVGGMSIKGGIVDKNGKIIYKAKQPIVKENAILTLELLLNDIMKYCHQNNILLQKAGIGVPCIFDKKTGVVSYGNNLDFKGVNLKELFLKNYNLGLEIANDAAVAVLGEHKFGRAKGCDNVVLITIGTGVGCGMVLGNKLISSNSSAVGEFSHTTIKMGGRKCTCGMRGCVEAYCSMTALYKDMHREMLKNKQSILWDKIDLNNIDGKVLFDCYNQDKTAKKVIDNFVKYLGVAVVNIANLLRPDIILIGGAVSMQGQIILKPIQKYLDDNIFAKEHTQRIIVDKATFDNDAGIIGASVLAM